MTFHFEIIIVQLSDLCGDYLSEEQCWDFLATYMAPLTATESTPMVDQGISGISSDLFFTNLAKLGEKDKEEVLYSPLTSTVNQCEKSKFYHFSVCRF